MTEEPGGGEGIRLPGQHPDPLQDLQRNCYSRTGLSADPEWRHHHGRGADLLHHICAGETVRNMAPAS